MGITHEKKNNPSILHRCSISPGQAKRKAINHDNSKDVPTSTAHSKKKLDLLQLTYSMPTSLTLGRATIQVDLMIKSRQLN